MLADLALLAKNPEAFNYHKKALGYRLESKYNVLDNLKDIRPIAKYKAIYQCFSSTCDKCRYLNGKLVNVMDAMENPIIPLENCLDTLCSTRIDFYQGEILNQVIANINNHKL